MAGFSENDIRPADLDTLRFEARDIDVAWLLARKSRFRPSGCPACGATGRFRLAYRKLGFTWKSCPDCRTAFMSPRPDAALLGEFYARSALYKVWNDHVFPASRDVRRNRIFAPRVQRTIEIADRLGAGTGTIVEVGAAHGLFCDVARETGRFARIIAIEPSASQAATCRSLGIETIEAAVEAVTGLDGSADIVAAFETLEHLASPLDFMRAAGRLLRPGGLIVLTTPNVAGFDVATLGAASDTVYPEHVTLFTPDGLRRLASRAGIETVEITTPGQLDADIVRKAALAGTLDLSAQPLLRAILLERWDELGHGFQQFLAANGLSSHLWFVGRRAAEGGGP